MSSQQDIFNKQLEKLKKLSGLDIRLDTNPDKIVSDTQKISLLIESLKAPAINEVFKEFLLGGESYDKIKPRLEGSGIRENTDYCLFTVYIQNGVDKIVLDILKGLFPGSKDYIVNIDSQSLCIIHKHSAVLPSELAHSIADIINTEAMKNALVTYSNVENDFSRLKELYDESRLCIDTARIFQPDRYVFSSSELGIGGLLYELPVSACTRFLNEVLTDKSAFKLDEDSLHTVDTFLANNLNIAETARNLNMHRNTLVYRIEQLAGKTGLDIRSFEGAMLFKLASLIICYLNSKERT